MTANNKFYLKIPTNNQSIQIPIEIKWDFFGQDDSVEMWESDVLENIIGTPKDFEIARFSHHEYSKWDNNQLVTEITKLNYDFYFYNSNNNTWVNNYRTIFTSNEVYYRSNAFKRSFFKLDFYDTNEPKTQINYFTIILPTNLGEEEQNVTLSQYLPQVNVKKPSFFLDFIKQKQGFFIYWLRYRDFLNINTFYMSVKFFDAKNGEFIKMITTPQNLLSNQTQFNGGEFFYKKVVLDYSDKTYKIFDVVTNNREGVGTPINWYQYVNP